MSFTRYGSYVLMPAPVRLSVLTSSFLQSRPPVTAPPVRFSMAFAVLTVLLRSKTSFSKFLMFPTFALVLMFSVLPVTLFAFEPPATVPVTEPVNVPVLSPRFTVLPVVSPVPCV